MTKEFIYAGTEYIFHASTREEWDGLFYNSYGVDQKARKIIAVEDWKTGEHAYNLDVTPNYRLDDDFTETGMYRIQLEFGTREQAEARFESMFKLVSQKGIFRDWESRGSFETKDEVTQ